MVRPQTERKQRTTVAAAAAVLLACWAGPVAAQPLLVEDFDGGAFPPPGWTVQNGTGGPVVWDLAGVWGWDNQTGGSGESAAADSFGAFENAYDTSLITPVIALPDSPHLTLSYRTAFEPWSGDESADVDVSTDGATWQNLLRWAGLTDTAAGTVNVPLADYAGRDVRVRFRYHNADPYAWDGYWQIDDVRVLPGPHVRAGDTDGDGDLDHIDYLVLKVNMGTDSGAGWERGDFDFDGDVDFADYAAARDAFEAALADPPGVVPVPGTLGLLAASGWVLLRRRRA